MGRRKNNSLFGLSDEALGRIRQGAVSLAKGLAERRPKAFVFTATHAGDGCTSTTFETARAMRDALGLKPLVVVLSPVNGTIARTVTLNAERGLEDMRDAARTLASCTQSGPYDLPTLAWHATPNGSETTGNLQHALSRTLAQCDGTYDVVIVDSSPFLQSAETVSACQVIPNVVLVLLAGHTRYEVLERITADLQEQGATLVGTVLNKHRKIIPNWFYRAFLK